MEFTWKKQDIEALVDYIFTYRDKLEKEIYQNLTEQCPVLKEWIAYRDACWLCEIDPYTENLITNGKKISNIMLGWVVQKQWDEFRNDKSIFSKDIEFIINETLLDCVVRCCPTFSRSKIRQFLKDGAIKINQEKQSDPFKIVNKEDMIQIGKRDIFRLI